MVGLTKKREEELPAEKPGVTTSTGLQVLTPPPGPPFCRYPLLSCHQAICVAQASCLGAPVAWLFAC